MLLLIFVIVLSNLIVKLKIRFYGALAVLITQLYKNYGRLALLMRENDLERIVKEIVAVDEFLTAVNTRKAAI
jgi:hypothetical protein